MSGIDFSVCSFLRNHQILVQVETIILRKNNLRAHRVDFDAFSHFAAFFFVLKDTDVCNFADDISPHACDIRLDELLMRLEHDSTNVESCSKRIKSSSRLISHA